MFKKTILFLLIISIIFAGCGSWKTYQKSDFFLYSIFDVKIDVSNKTDSVEADSILKNCLDSLRDLDNRLNPLNPISDINAINSGAGKTPVKIGTDIYEMFEKAFTAAELTTGAFDLTMDPLVTLFKNNEAPTQQRIDSIIKNTNYTNILLEPSYRTVRFSEAAIKISFDLMKQGYAIDKITEALKKRQVRSAVIRAGTTLFSHGSKEKYTVIVPHPENPKKRAAKFSFKNKGYSSISLENPMYAQHKTWLPQFRKKLEIEDTSEPLYVGIIAPNALTAEVLAHAFFVLGKDRGAELINKLKYEFIYIARLEDGSLKAAASASLKKKIKGIKLF